jgi:hypothetical protein
MPATDFIASTETNSALVRINEDALASYAVFLASQELEVPNWRLPVYPEADTEDFIEFIGVMNALNFCFADPSGEGKFAAEYRGTTWGGATGLCAALMRAIDEGIDILDPTVLSALDMVDAQHIFRSEETPLPLLELRLAFLNSLAPSLEPYGSFACMFRKLGYDAERIITALATEFPAYAGDRWLDPVTKRQTVFDKRARLMPLIYEGRARHSGGVLPCLSNVSSIGPIIDYQLPRALRDVGVLEYAPSVASAVDAGHLVPPGSDVELALRGVTYDAVARLLEMLRASVGSHVSMVELDFVLWVNGRKASGRHHLTLTTAY